MATTHERIKTVLLVVLIVGAVFMAYSTWFFDNPMGDGALRALISGEVTNVGGEYTMQSAGSAREMSPLRISVKNDYGRVGAEYSVSQVEALYDNTRGLMAEAFSIQSGRWYSIDEDTWREALGWQGVLYDYQGLVRADSVTQWLWGGQSEVGDIMGRYLLLAVNPKSEKTLIIMKNPHTDEIYAGETQVDKSTVLSVIDGIAGEAHFLACELPDTDYEKLVPESFIREDGQKPAVINGYNVAAYFTEEQRESFIKSFGFAPYSVSEHVEQDGTRVYIQESGTVRIENDGFAVYTDTGSDAQSGIFVQSASDTPSAAEIFETGRIIVSRLAGIAGGAGRLYPLDFRYFKQHDCWVADFGWSVNGIPVDRQDTGYAARVVISGRRVLEVHFYMRSYQSTDRVAGTISKKLAAAAVGKEDEFCELELRYTDGGQSELEPGWYKKNRD